MKYNDNIKLFYIIDYNFFFHCINTFSNVFHSKLELYFTNSCSNSFL